MTDWNLDSLEQSNSFNIGRASPLLIVGIFFMIAPYIAKAFSINLGFLSTVCQVFGVILMVGGVIFSIMGRM